MIKILQGKTVVNKLNKIDGVSLPDDAYNRLPKIQLSVLEDGENMRQFLGIWEDYMEQIRGMVD